MAGFQVTAEGSGRRLHLSDMQIDETKLADLCGRYRVRELPLFGSAGRGQMRPGSDIDMLVDFCRMPTSIWWATPA
jgi:predicted nucleotidyltransferase